MSDFIRPVDVIAAHCYDDDPMWDCSCGWIAPASTTNVDGKTYYSMPAMTLTTGSIFSGYAGLDMAVNAHFGSETAWFVEKDAAPARILTHHWPDVPNHRPVDGGDVAALRILTPIAENLGVA